MSDKPFAGFVAVKGNRIAAVGKEMDSISQYAGDDTKIIDAGDRLVMPGFHDSHTHLILAGCTRHIRTWKRQIRGRGGSDAQRVL